MENDKMVRLEEMKDSIEETLENLHKVYEQQITLLEVVRSSDKKDMFKDLCDDMSSQLTEMNKQSVTLLKRSELLQEVIDECKVDEKSKAIVLKVLDVFGIFEEN